MAGRFFAVLFPEDNSWKSVFLNSLMIIRKTAPNEPFAAGEICQSRLEHQRHFLDNIIKKLF